MAKNLPEMPEIWVWSFCPEDPWRRKWLPIPILLPGESHAQRSLVATVHGVSKSWTLRTDAFELWYWRRLLRVPWTARRSSQSILKEISPEYSLEWLMLKPLTPVLWPPDPKNWLIWKDRDAGKDWRWEEKGTTEDEMVGWHHWLNEHEFE